MNEKQKERIKKLRRMELKNLISEIRFLLEWTARYGCGMKDMVTDSYCQLQKMWKARNDFSFLEVRK